MTIAFSTQWPKNMPKHMAGKPTYFVEKIFNAFTYNCTEKVDKTILEEYAVGLFVRGYRGPFSGRPKVHTIREDKKNNWKPGNDIHFVINNRTPDRFQFAPVIKCVSVQNFKISYHIIKNWDGTIKNDNAPMIRIDGRVLNGTEAKDLALNDGFDSLEDFLSWFNKDFNGKIIHWTDLKY